MRSPKRTTGSETSVWTVPWSTRAVILLAFAIQLMPVSERVGHPSHRPTDRLVFTDGRLVALWFADRAAQQAVPARGPLIVFRSSAAGPKFAPVDLAVGTHSSCRWTKCGLMPMPPPPAA